MTFAVEATIVFVISILSAARLKERALYVLFFTAFTQNLALAYLYTNGLAGLDICRALILFKEFLLFALFAYSLVLLQRRADHWPRPLLILFVFTAYCIVRFAFGAAFLGDFSADGLRKLRMMCYPAQILTVGYAFGRVLPRFTKTFVRRMTYSLAVLGLVGILLFLLPGADFWKQHADIASYNMDVKGEDISTVNAEEGIPGTGEGREAFLFLSSFRAMGTFADPLAFGFCMAMPALLLGFYYRKNWLTLIMLALCGAAIFFTFSRSSWIFVTLSLAYIFLRKRQYRLILTVAAAVIAALLVWPPLTQFANSDYAYLSWNHPGDKHAQGIVWFYQRAFTDPGNILGKGMDDSVQTIPESGYAFLIEHFGFAAYASFIYFCFSLFALLRKRERENGLTPILCVAQAIPLSILIVMHTSQYPFAFIEYLLIWFIAGMCMCRKLRLKGVSNENRQLAA